ncbi:MAG: HDOD domain-containing protein [Desulfobacterales bacterium]|nr:MAG: HDOD domain-containing protein [Desulfobacterales bacterium]
MHTDRSLLEIINHRLASAPVRLPAFGAVALRIQQEIGKAQPDIRAIEKLILRDQALTGEVVRVARSAVYRNLAEVSTLRDVIQRLGIREVANIVALITYQHHFRSKDPGLRPALQELWRHSVGCAVGAHWLAERTPSRVQSHETFLAGLLHDVGKLFLLTVIDDIHNCDARPRRPSAAGVAEALTALHTDCGWALMNHWNLPAQYCHVVRAHHAQAFEAGDSLLLMVRLANQACHKMGLGRPRDSALTLEATPEAHLLKLSEVDLARLEVRLEDAAAHPLAIRPLPTPAQR